MPQYTAASLYIFWFLHQTTTPTCVRACVSRCISFDSYIKPQPESTAASRKHCCISFDSYIKPQPLSWRGWSPCVVYLLIPTSNHNLDGSSKYLTDVVYLLIPTSNHNKTLAGSICIWLYIFWFLHQTTTVTSISQSVPCCISFDSYIKPQQHGSDGCFNAGCISFDSYIKPQLVIVFICIFAVVYLLIPTSNHNPPYFPNFKLLLYIFWFLHQTTTVSILLRINIWLYIFWFLHQTTTCSARVNSIACCISFDSYIKPQPSAWALC